MMTLSRRQALTVLASSAAWPLAGHGQALEQAKVLYGFPAGSAGDLTARRVAERMGASGYAKTPPFVENKPGAGGRLALEQLKSSPADGSVLAVTPMSPVSLYPHVYRKMSYEPADFAPVSIATIAHHGLGVAGNLPASVTDIKSFLAWAKANPDKASYGSPGAGSTPHLIGALLGLQANVPLNHVPYRGTAPGVAELVGGQIASMVSPSADLLAHHRAGRVRLLATSGRQRSPFSPDIPTFAEQGYPELTVEEWFAFFAPARTPASVIAAANAAINAALKEKAVIDSLNAVGLIVQGSTPEELGRSQRAEFERWGPLIKRIGFTADS